MPTTRLADVTSILSRIRDHDRLVLAVYTRPYDRMHKFDIELKLQEEHSKIEVQRDGADFMDVLIEAWRELERLCIMGAGAKALEPKALPSPAADQL